MPLASGGSARSQGQAEDGQDAPRRPVQLQCAAMGPGDLLHQPEAGAVGGPAVRGQSDLRQSDRQTTTPVVLHPQGAYFPLGCRSQGDGAALRVVAHAVVHQVKQGPPQQGRVPLQRKGFGLRRHLHRQGVPLLQPAVEHVGRHLPHQGGGVEAPPPQGP